MGKQLSSQAAAAKMIRQDLKTAFPSVRFTVTSSGFSGGNAVDVHWNDGPTSAQIDAVIGKYQYGHFDGMIDLYETSNRRDDIPQAKYVHGSRTISNTATLAAIALLNKTYRYDIQAIEYETWVKIADNAMLPTNRWPSMEVNYLLHHTSMICRHCHAHTLPGDVFCPDCGKVLGCIECKEPFGDISNRQDEINPDWCWSCAYDIREKQTA